MSKRNTIFIFIAIVSLAGYFRLSNLDLIEFKVDEALNVFLAARPLFGHPFAALGTVSSVGIPNPPLFNYLLFPIVFFTTNPIGITFFIGFVNTLTIGLIFLFIKRYYGTLTGFITAVFLAVSPWAILFSRKIWAPDLIMPFLIGLLWSSHVIVFDNKKKYWALYIFLSLLLIQLHQSTLFFIAPLTIFLLVEKRSSFSLQYAFLGFLLGLLPLLPFLYYEIHNGCPDCFAIAAAAKKVAAVSSATVFMRNLQILGTGYFNFVFGTEDFLVFKQSFPFTYIIRYLFYLTYLLLPIGMCLFYKQNKKSRFLIYTTIAVSIMYYFFRVEPLMHYYITALPLLFLFLSYTFVYFLKKIKLSKILFSILFISLIIAYGIFNLAFISFLKIHNGTRGDYGGIFSQNQKNSKKALAGFISSKNYPEIIITYFVPPSAMTQNPSLAKMLYPTQETEKKLTLLEAKLKDTPDDILTQIELTAYFRQKINLPTMILLRQKANDIPGFRSIYQQMYNLYLDEMLKRAFIKSGFPIAFEYPSYWQVKEEYPKKISVYSDEVTLSLLNITNTAQNNSLSTNAIVSKMNTLGKNYQKKRCVTKEKYWCGTSYESFLAASYIFHAILLPNSPSQIKNDRAKEIEKAVDQILTSIRIKTGSF
ncbi:MAG: glycosyltransferase family 39 protein [Candidatus Levyibacteriota bacterium]|nr:MAG: glycosyltransferase family 39 protein [Candidatus Levybacteria bacterium]